MIYADSGIIIRLIEGVDKVRAPIMECLRQIDDPDRIIVTSRLTTLECRCRPMRDGQDELLGVYDRFFSSREVILRELDAAVVEKATVLRASSGLRTPDAIHAATAILSGASAFWTTDKRFSKCAELAVQLFQAA